MGISDGQPVDAANSNPAWLDANADDQAIGKIDFVNTEAPSGPNVINIQREVNSLNSFLGRIAGSIYNALPSWLNSQVGTGSDNVFDRADALTERFDGTTGHTHTGSTGEGPRLTDASITTPFQGFPQEALALTGVTGGSTDVSTEFAAKEPSTGTSVKGVPSTAPYNEVMLLNTSTQDYYEDGSGNRVYGRLTNSGGLGGTWTLTYYSRVAGVETAYSFSGSNDVSLYYQELFHPLESARPVYSQQFFVPSDNATADILDASLTQSGKVNIVQQTFGGEKNFDGGIATERQDVASAATIAAFSSAKSFARITGATPTDLQGIAAPANSTNKRLIIYNASSADLTVSHEDAGASAANRILTPEAADMTIAAGTSIEFIYDDAQSRWIVVSSGAGSGGGQYKVLFSEGTPQDVTAVGGVDLTGQGIRTLVFVQGDGGPVEVTANPQIDPGVEVGDELLVWGKSDTNTLTLNDGTGLSLNGSITLGDNDLLKLVWSGTVWAEQSRSV